MSLCYAGRDDAVLPAFTCLMMQAPRYEYSMMERCSSSAAASGLRESACVAPSRLGALSGGGRDTAGEAAAVPVPEPGCAGARSAGGTGDSLMRYESRPPSLGRSLVGSIEPR